MLGDPEMLARSKVIRAALHAARNGAEIKEFILALHAVLSSSYEELLTEAETTAERDDLILWMLRTHSMAVEAAGIVDDDVERVGKAARLAVRNASN